MSAEIPQQYIVHLDIPAVAADPSEAVQGAIDKVVLGGLQDVVYSVEAVGEPAARLDVLPGQHDPARTLEDAGAATSHESAHVYGGEFLG